MARWNTKNMTVYIESADGAVSERLGPTPGDFSMDNVEAGNYEVMEARDQGVHDGLFEGPDLVQAWSMTLELGNQTLTHATQMRILDALRGTGKFLGALSANSEDPNIWAPVIRVVFSNGTTTAQIRLPKNRVKGNLSVSMEAGTVAFSGTNYLAPEFT